MKALDTRQDVSVRDGREPSTHSLPGCDPNMAGRACWVSVIAWSTVVRDSQVRQYLNHASARRVTRVGSTGSASSTLQSRGHRSSLRTIARCAAGCLFRHQFSSWSTGSCRTHSASARPSSGRVCRDTAFMDCRTNTSLRSCRRLLRRLPTVASSSLISEVARVCVR